MRGGSDAAKRFLTRYDQKQTSSKERGRSVSPADRIHKSTRRRFNSMWVHTKRKAACVAISGPSLGRKRPRWAAIAGSATARPIDKTIATGGSIERRYRSGIQTGNGTYTKVKALAL